MVVTISSDSKDNTCIVIPTFCRSDGLLLAVESLFLQDIISPEIKILVVDNNPNPIEKAPIEKLSQRFNHNIEYIHEANAGVSNARNAAMKAISGYRYIAFLDDDMAVSPTWLSSLIETSKTFQAGLTFGPTQAVMPNKDDPRNIYMEPFFERVIDKAEDGLIEETLGTGGCLLDLKYCKLPNPPFNPALNESGGEDDIFFDHLRQTGTLVAWSTQAISYELVPASRATADYIWKRNFGYGQGPTRIQASRGLSGLIGVAYFMTTGTIQFLAFCPQLMVKKLTKSPSQVKYAALTARALGKIFWSRKFSPLLYGKAAL